MPRPSSLAWGRSGTALRAGKHRWRGASGIRARRWGRTHHPETDAVAAGDREAPVAVGTAGADRTVVPGPAAQRTGSAEAVMVVEPRPTVGWRPLVVPVPSVLDPLPDIGKRKLNRTFRGGSGSRRLAAVGMARQTGTPRGRQLVQASFEVHDAFLVDAAAKEIEGTVEGLQACMREASRIVLDGLELGSDAVVVRAPERYRDKRGAVMWGRQLPASWAEWTGQRTVTTWLRADDARAASFPVDGSGEPR